MARPDAPPDAVPPSAWLSLALLFVVYLLNFLDRTLIFILFGPIKKEMVFSDLQLALLGSTAFVLFYTALGLPFGRLADRVSRVKMIAAGLAVWSLFSGLTGMAWDFWSLFLCRVMVGVGEATLGPAAMSLLSDLFPPSRRAQVQSIYSAGIPMGAAAAFFLGGQIGAAWGWRWAFFTLGFPGVLLALLVLLIPEPTRGATEAPRPATSPAAAAEPTARDLLASAPLRWHVAGYAMMAVAGNSLSIWVPSLLSRAHQIPLTEIGNLSGLSMALSGGLATAFGGGIADRMKARRRGGRLQFSMILALLCAPLWLTLLLSGDTRVMFACFFLLAGVGLAWLGPAAADIHDCTGPKLRGLGIAAYFLVVNLVGYGVAPLIVGKVSDLLGTADHPERLAWALFSAPAACLVAALCLWRGQVAMESGPEAPTAP